MKKGRIPIVVIITILLIAVIIVTVLIVVYSNKNIATKNGTTSNGASKENAVKSDVFFQEKYEIITDIDAISEEEWQKLNGTGAYAMSYKYIFDLRYEHNIGTVQGKLSIPRTEFSIYMGVDEQNFYKINVNKNKWFYPTDIATINTEIDTVSSMIDFYVLDTEIGFNKITLCIDENDIERYDTEEYTESSYNNWTFKVSKQYNNAVAYLKLTDDYCLKADLTNKNLTTDTYAKFFEAFSKNVTVEKTSNVSFAYVKLPSEYSNIKINDNFTLNLIDNIYLDGWKIGTKINEGNNIITFALRDSRNNVVQLSEEKEGITMDNIKNQLSGTVNFKTYQYNGLNLELMTYGKTFLDELGGRFEGKFIGVLLQIDDRVYKLEYLTPIEITSEAQLIENLDYLFNKVLIYNK